jgi:hypothetical protein
MTNASYGQMPLFLLINFLEFFNLDWFLGD